MTPDPQQRATQDQQHKETPAARPVRPIVFFVIVAILVAAVVYFAQHRRFGVNGHGSGDTPAILIGGTLTFKSGAQSSPPGWSSNAINAEHPIQKVVLRQDAPKDDPTKSDPADKSGPALQTVDVSNAKISVEVDAYSGSSPVARLVQDLNTKVITVSVSGGTPGTPTTLCAVPGSGNKEIAYSQSGACPAAITFSSATVLVDGAQVGSIPCQASGATPGHCRIVLKD